MGRPEVVRSFGHDRPVERGDHRRQPVEPLGLQLDAEPARSADLRLPQAETSPWLRRWREAERGSARLPPGSAGSRDAATEPAASPDGRDGGAWASRASARCLAALVTVGYPVDSSPCWSCQFDLGSVCLWAERGIPAIDHAVCATATLAGMPAHAIRLTYPMRPGR
jgi:hypothetical protein